MKWLHVGLALAILTVSTHSEESAEPTLGHSQHGEVFNEGPRQAAVLIPGTGNIDFPVSTSSKEAQQFFHQGVGQLHGFWNYEAERSFRQAAALDPDSAMFYWGMAMANQSNAKRAKGFIAEAKERLPKATAREKAWIEAVAPYFENDKIDEKKRRRDLVRALEGLVRSRPDDVEAKAFLMKQIYHNAGKGHPLPSHLAIDLLIGEILKRNPDHPSHHYRIHLWDREKPALALESAARCGPAAPAIAHMWHMPGHIYSRLHRYRDAVWQQEASARIDHAHMMRYRITPDRIHNFAHNNEWLIRNFNHLGQVERALELARNMIELPRLPKLKDGAYDHNGGSWNYGRQRLRDTLIRFELWDQLLHLGKTDYLKPGTGAITNAEWHRIMGIASFERGNRAEGLKLLADAETGWKSQKKKQDEAIEKAEAENADKTVAEKKKAVEAARKKFKTQLDAWDKTRKELAAYDTLTAEPADPEAAGKALDGLKSMSKSRKARLFWTLGDRDKALKLIGEEVKASPGQVQPLAIQAWMQWESGDMEQAALTFETLRTVGQVADLNLPAFARLTPLIASLSLEKDWRIPQEPAGDLGDRPDLASLGPFRWEPPAAPNWILPDAGNQSISLADYSGKPVVVLFFLGRECLHCMEQLAAFAPLTERFRDAGMDLIAVSTDSSAGLRETYLKGTDDSRNPFPFPLVADSELTTFRAYRAYDDFESMALHGTFLIDAAGHIRWQEIGFEPFMHPEFLLEECQRLLSYGDS